MKETNQNRIAEAEILEEFKSFRQLDYVKTAAWCPFDYVGIDDDRINIILEVKDRQMASDKYWNTLIDAGKIKACLEWAESIRCAFILIIRFTDCICYLNVGSIKGKINYQIGRKNDSDEDPGCSIFAMIPVNLFSKLE